MVERFARYRVFLSYSSRDKDEISDVAEQLRELGLDAYVAEHDGRAGDSVAVKILSQIRKSDVLVVLLTNNGFSSAYVQQEIGAAQMAGKLVVPLVAPDVDRSRLAMLQGLEFIEFDASRPDDARDRLVLRLSSLARTKEQQTVLLVVAALVVTLILLSSPPR